MSGRIRTVKPEWLEDELLAGASDEARVLSIALILMADDHGRGRASIATIASGAWRYQMERDDGAHAPEVVARASRALRELAAIGFVKLYDVARQRYYELPNWTKHQKVDRPGKPRVPVPCVTESLEDSISRECVASASRDIRETLATDLIPHTSYHDQEGDLAGMPAREPPAPEASPETPRPKPADPMRRSLAARPEVPADRLGIADVERTFSELRVAARRGRYSNPAQRDDERLAGLAKFANDGGATRAERDAVLRACILGFLGDVTSGPRWPLAFLANDPGGFQAMHEGAAPVASGADPVSLAQAARDRAEKALAESRRYRDSVAGGDGHTEAVADFLRKQRALGDADDVLEAAKRRVA